MQLLDLPDEDLTKIFSYVDHFSLLDTMLVCRRFESLISQNIKFYKKFKIVIDHQRMSLDKIREGKKVRFMYFRRYFDDITLNGFTLYPSCLYSSPLLKNLENIGSKINKLAIKSSEGHMNSILEVFLLANNIRELKLKSITINEYPLCRTYKKIDIKKLTFPELKCLELSSIHNVGIVKKAFSAVTQLTHMKLVDTKMEDWDTYQQLLFKQKYLRSLVLDGVDVKSFELANWNLDKLVMKNVMFPKKEAFQTFTSFIKSLNNVSELELDIFIDQLVYPNNYTEILEHLLNLPSLTKLKWHSPNTTNLKILNPSVKQFSVFERFADYLEVFRVFPGIQTLEFPKNPYENNSWFAMQFLEQLNELKFSKIPIPNYLSSINCPKIKKFSIIGSMSFTDASSWVEFVKNHPDLEYFEVKSEDNSYMWNHFGPHYVEYFKSFTKLKTLKIYDVTNIRNETRLIRFIGDRLTSLEHLEIVLSELNTKVAIRFLRFKFPQMACDWKKYDKCHNNLITVRKF